MNKLKLEHLAPYLPYELDVTFDGDEYTHRVVGLSIASSRGVELISPFGHFGTARVEDCIPILRPLSDLISFQKELLKLNIVFMENEWFYLDHEQEYSLGESPIDWSYLYVQKLLSWRFDIFGLIDKGLAIDINSLKGGSK